MNNPVFSSSDYIFLETLIRDQYALQRELARFKDDCKTDRIAVTPVIEYAIRDTYKKLIRETQTKIDKLYERI